MKMFCSCAHFFNCGKTRNKTPAIDTIIHIANIMTGKISYMKVEMDRLGLKELTIPQIIKFAQDGEVSAKREEVVA